VAWKTGLDRIFAALGYKAFNTKKFFAQDGLYTLHNDHFRRDAAFQAAYARGVKASWGVDAHIEWRVHIALWGAKRALQVAGDFVECGVNAGFISSALMQGLDWNSTERRFFLIDTFAGPVVEQYTRTEIEHGRLRIAEAAKAAGAYVTDLERVRNNYAEWRNAVIVQGAVPEILRSLDIGAVAFLHIDMNCSYPEVEALKFFWPRLSPGAVVLLDDYAYLGHEEQAKAMDETARALTTEILSLPTGQGLLIKGRST
jgi:hypothetical protein